MNSIRKILIIPTLLPFLIVVFISVLNWEKKSNIRILTWTSPSFSLGLLMLTGTGIGATYSIIPALLTFHNKSGTRRKVKYEVDTKERAQIYEDSYQEDYRSYEQLNSEKYKYNSRLERDVKDPKPTISVPFRIIQKVENHYENSLYDYDREQDDSERKEYQSNKKTSRDEKFEATSTWEDDLEEDW